MTREAVYIYDSQFSYPFHYFGNLHMDDITCITWSPNGDILVVSSVEGFNAFLTIDLEAIGNKHPNPPLHRSIENDEIVSAPDSPKLAKPSTKKTPKKVKEIKEKPDEPKEKEVNLLIPRSIKSQKTLSEFFTS